MRVESRDASLAVDKGEFEKKLINRLRRVEGQLRGVERLIEEHADCHDVLTQLSAARGALDQLGVTIISGKLKECVGAENQEDRIDELLRKFLKGAVK